MWRYLFAVFVAVSAPIAAEQPVRQTQVPAGLLLAAAQEPLAFAMALSDASVPNGLEVHAPVKLPTRKPDFDLKTTSTVELSEVVKAFNNHHANYHAQLIDGVVVVRPQGQRVPHLDAPSKLESEVVTGLMEATIRVFKDVHPALAGGHGEHVGSSINADDNERGEFHVVTLNGHGRSVLEVLNQVAKQGSRGWIVVTNEEQGKQVIQSIGLIHHRGSITRVDLS